MLFVDLGFEKMRPRGDLKRVTFGQKGRLDTFKENPKKEKRKRMRPADRGE